MGSLAVDTSVSPVGEGRFEADLSPDWEIWGPNGGYLAAVALRAAGVAAGRARPASINAHIVGAGRSGPVEISTSVNRHTRVASSVSVELTQGGRPWLVAQVWGVDDDLPGLDHLTSARPHDVSDHGALRPLDELLPEEAFVDRHPFWSNVEQRHVDWIENWDDREATEPRKDVWYRFVPEPTFADPWIDAARSLIVIDLDAWPATCLAHPGALEVFAPTIEVTARFCGETSDAVWLLGRAHAPMASGGTIAATSQVWTDDHRLVAIGGSTLLCRPAVRRPDA